MSKKHLVTALVALGVVLGLFTPVMPSAQALPCGRVSGCTKFELVHAGATYGWYPVKHRFEFKGGRTPPKQWKLHGTGKLYQQNGMLTLVGAKGRPTQPVRTVWKNTGYRTGRWEVRMRTARESKGNTDYTVEVALVPAAAKARHCGAQDVVFLKYNPSRAKTAQFASRTLPKVSYRFDKGLKRKVGSDEWHEFAVEIKKNRITWFIDAKAVATSTKPAAFKHVPLTMEARLVPAAGKVMNKTRLQLDWARYWTLKKKGKHGSAVATAPKLTEKTYADAC